MTIRNSTTGKTSHGVRFAAAATKQQAPQFIKTPSFRRGIKSGYIKKG